MPSPHLYAFNLAKHSTSDLVPGGLLNTAARLFSPSPASYGKLVKSAHMTCKISNHHARYLRLAAQGLLRQLGGSPVDAARVVGRLEGIQAQEGEAAFLSIAARSSGLTTLKVNESLLTERSILRTWAMRGTLHLVPTQDIDWLLALLAPVIVKRNQPRYAELGLDEAELQSGVFIIREQLASHGPLTRHELAPHLARQGLNTTGQALIYLVNRAAWEGVLCLGPVMAGKQAYVWLPDWIGRDLSPQDGGAHVLLAERYLAAYGPATPRDFSAWSGLPSNMAADAWKALGDRLVELEFPGGSGVILTDQAPRLDDPPPRSLGVQLLPKFDTFLLGYADRSLLIASEHIKKVNAGGGIQRPALLVDGCVQGTWRITQQRTGVKITVEAFGQLPAHQVLSLEREVEAIGRFLPVPAELVFE
jgi:hypothetical protein